MNRRAWASWAVSLSIAGASAAVSGCGGDGAASGGSGGAGGGGAAASGGAGGGTGGVIVPDGVDVPDAVPGVVDDSPTSPPDDAGGALSWPEAPLLPGVSVAAGRDGARIVLPVVEGAQDYRVFAIPEGVSIVTDAGGHEQVLGTTVFCAGFRQHNAPAGPMELLRQVEVAGLTGETRLVVEAIDTPCPFTGVRGTEHADLTVDNSALDPADFGSFSVFTEAEITKEYGSLIVNGHAPGPELGGPAPLQPTAVLARTTLRVTPSGLADPPLAFFEDFASSDQPVYVSPLPVFDRTQKGKLYQNQRFTFTTYGADVSQSFVDRGQLHTLLADWEQEIFASNVMYPRAPVALSGTDYLHVSFRVGTDATQRRYWWLSLCGAAEPGATMDADGKPLGNIIQTPFFYQDDGLNPSVEGWNCLQVFPRDGYPFSLPPTDTAPESDVRVMVNLPDRPLRESVVNVSPPMYDSGVAEPGWYRQRDASGDLVAPILDDRLLIAPGTRFDFYIRRDRVVMYVEGEQRLCNDFPGVPLTMAEAALGFGHVLYHSAAERLEFNASYWDRTGQRYYLANTPFIDVRAWDDVGYTEHVPAPPGFSEGACYVSPATAEQ